MRNGGINSVNVFAESIHNAPQGCRLKEGHRRSHDAKEKSSMERATTVHRALGHGDGTEKDKNG